ncbi:unnamed protein product [Didymodactylos carnosus]|uniref:Vacuolar protein sorting-associated protein 72 homolog n=1 Tax=Didymodactylos carnosus TaxID=1234261 RepID=A0A814J6H0_9BILA|nr:unnamed protein product [Didymodactylos carnosus]CAF1033235.1 unnamed protein product [Didymodactylos carnosus]CAF3631532.1 unnamed protein product [Didymodactylos carnosus]CAF3803984.1 unnamed protein product [Didymodactylos carnosus]
MSLVTDRDKRQNAGNRLQRLLEQQDDQEDEFYGSAYGGFLDEEEDNDYRSEESEDDVVDSDFDNEETDNHQQQEDGDNQNSTVENEKKEDDDDFDEDGKRPAKRKKIIYQAQCLQEGKVSKKQQQQSTTTAPDDNSTEQESRGQRLRRVAPVTEAKTLRKSTSVKRVELEKRQREREERQKYLKNVAAQRNTDEVRRLTQEELLEEAKLTEEINLASLGMLLEAYFSVTVTEHPHTETYGMVNDQSLTSDSNQPHRYSRQLLSFTHLNTYNESFPRLQKASQFHDNNDRPPHVRRRRLCPVTNLPAQYFDPLTQMPYANLEAFKTLRKIYHEEKRKQTLTTSSTMLMDIGKDLNPSNIVNNTELQQELEIDLPSIKYIELAIKTSYMTNSRVYFDVYADSSSLGRIVFELFDNECPKTAENFRSLTTMDKGYGYKSSIFHRVINGYFCQGGDFTNYNGTGGKSIYGKKFDDENFNRKFTHPGLLAMANSGENTNSSQFFITLIPCPWLNGKHVVFGHVVEGMDVVKQIDSYGSETGTPTRRIIIQDCGQL